MSIARTVVLALTLAACQPPPAPEVIPGDLPRTGATLETVYDKPVTQGMLDAMVSAIPEQAREQLEQSGQIARLQDQLIKQDALYQTAIREGLHKDEKVQTMLRLAEREALIEALLRKVVEERTTDEAMKTWYDEHLVQFRNPQVKAAHILAESEADAKAIKAELDGGADFATLASQRSKDPQTAAKGGEIGWVSRRELPPQLSGPLLEAETGAILEPLEGPGGRTWHVFKILEKRDVTPFDEVKDQVQQRMQSEVVEAYVKEIEEAAVKKAAEGEGAQVTPPPVGAPPAGAPPAPPAGGGQ
ncbi:MAG: peptidyl-prolyl cis-trans isomerase [Alphaproteobacteria bacterium]|nr:peptidyl-prolyl cis-trans isomerase [Alphaproteobacteria bacterium]